MASASGNYCGRRGAWFPGDVVQMTSLPTWGSCFPYGIAWYGSDIKYHTTKTFGCCIVVDRAVIQIKTPSPHSRRWYMFYQILLTDGALVWTTGFGIDKKDCETDKTYSLTNFDTWPAVYDQFIEKLTFNKSTKMWMRNVENVLVLE